jgi:Putative prokaryotic signal transducing protein
MVRLATVQSGFEAKVMAARLGAEGIVWELRGGVDGPYPMGPVHVLVDENDLDVARELLMVDEVESAFEHGQGMSTRPMLLMWIGLAAVVVVAASTFLRVLAATQ